jgi:hypothetical protein
MAVTRRLRAVIFFSGIRRDNVAVATGQAQREFRCYVLTVSELKPDGAGPQWTPESLQLASREWRDLPASRAHTLLTKRLRTQRWAHRGFTVVSVAATLASCLVAAVGTRIGSPALAALMGTASLFAASYGLKTWRSDRQRHQVIEDCLRLVAEPGATVAENGAVLQVSASKTFEVPLMLGEMAGVRSTLLPQARVLTKKITE